MAHAGPMRLPHDWRIHNCRVSYNQHRSVVGKNRVQLVGINLSSHNLRQDSWSLHVLGSIRCPVAPASTRCNVLLCRCVVVPGGGNEIPLLKSAAVIWTRAQGSPLAKLIPAAGVIAFAAWGLEPLIRLGRVICFNRTDSSWKKSSSYYVMTQYIQPLLWWSGAILLCRALDPVVLPSAASQAIKQRLLNFIRALSTVLAFAYCLSSLIQKAQNFFMVTQDTSGTRNMGFDFAGKAIYTGVWIAAVSLFMELLGFSTQKWVTAGGLGTVLLTLAGREIFTNFLSSVMIHATRPFVVNEWIQTKIEGYEVSGTVEHVGWWSPTIIRGDDREAVHIPNHKFTVNVVRNLSQKTHWRIKTYIAISHLDVNKINYIVADMRKVLAKNPQVEQQKLHRRVFLENIDPENQALMILVSCFVKTSHFEEHLCVKEAILLDLLRVVSHHGARLATPIRTVQKIYSTADLENVPFSDSIYSRSKGTTNREYLLLEPSYKVSGDDRTKTRQSEDKEAQAEGPSVADDSKAGSVPPNLDSKVEDRVATTSKPNTTSKISEASVPDQQTQDLAADCSSPKLKKEATTTTVDSKGTSETTKLPLAASSGQPKHGERSSMPAFEDNIVLGVALDGSKRTLPIEEEMEENIVLGVALDGSKRTLPIEDEDMPPPPPPETKELATQNSGNNTKDSTS